MPIEDSLPERRNLIVTSLCFIIYVIAGGTIKDNEVTLQVVNVVFTRTWVLACFAWILLFWFALRYHLSVKVKYKSAFVTDLKSVTSHWVTKTFLEFKLKRKYNQPDGYIIDNIQPVRSNPISFGTKLVERGTVDPNGRLRGHIEKETKVIPTNSFAGILYLFVISIILLFQRPSIRDFVVPYIIFWLAVIIGVIHFAL